MRVLWFVNMMMPEFSDALGMPHVNFGGWMPSLISAIRTYAPDIELCVVNVAAKKATKIVNGVKYVSVSIKSLDAVSQVIESFKPSVIHFHGTEDVFNLTGKYVKDWDHVVVSIQGIINGYYPHYMGGLTQEELWPYQNPIRWLMRRGSVRSSAKYWRTCKAVDERKGLVNVKHVLGRTDWDYAWAHYLCSDAVYYQVGELLRPEFYLAERIADNVKQHTIYCSAALSYPLKGGHWLLRAVSMLKRKYPDVRLRVANAYRCSRQQGLVGRLSQGQYHRYIMHMIDKLGISGCVELLPSLSASEVVRELCTAHVFCLPSLVENSPNSLGEAQLIGCPVVCTSVGGVGSMMRDNEDGLMVPACDPAMLAFAIDRIFSSSCPIGEFVANARERALKRHNPETVVGALIDVYRGIRI